MKVSELAAEILSWTGIDGLTLSGGEPFEQAFALAELCRILRCGREFSIMSYTGYTLEELVASSNADHRSLLQYIDILVDGPYIEARRADILWRGSANQRIHMLSDHHAELKSSLNMPGVGVELHVKRDGTFFWAGIPEIGFDRFLEENLSGYAIELRKKSEGWI
jgi:anaerobic ribonucleoside-triphosphate reductase activating protein